MTKKLDLNNLTIDFAVSLIKANDGLKEMINDEMYTSAYDLIEDYLCTLNTNGKALDNYSIDYFSYSYVNANSDNRYYNFLSGCKEMERCYEFFYNFDKEHTFGTFINGCFELRDKINELEWTDYDEDDWYNLNKELRTKVETLEHYIKNRFVSEYQWVFECSVEDKAQYLLDYRDNILTEEMEYDTDTLELFERISYIKSYRV